MTQSELVTLCKSLGFCGEPDRCVRGSYYANLNPEKYTGPTLIYQPVEDHSVYISPSVHITKKPHFFCGIYKMYAYEGVKDNVAGTYSMKEKYPKYDLSDDEQIKKALADLQKQWKSELNKIREEELEGDFNDTERT